VFILNKVVHSKHFKPNYCDVRTAEKLMVTSDCLAE